MNNRFIVVALAVLFLLSGPSLFAAEKWTPQQKEVWQVEETWWSLLQKKDIAGCLSYVHPDYMGWEYDMPLPAGKESSEKWMTFMVGQGDMLIYELTPVAIQVFGNFAFVDYYYYEVVKDKKGEQKDHPGRWTDILLKQDGKWLFIGDHGGSKPED